MGKSGPSESGKGQHYAKLYENGKKWESGDEK
jgi:hypothetical protein